MVAGLASHPLMLNVVVGAPASLRERVIGCVTVEVLDDPATMASTICEPDWPTLSVNPSVAPFWVVDTTWYSAELAIHEGTS